MFPENEVLNFQILIMSHYFKMGIWVQVKENIFPENLFKYLIGKKIASKLKAAN